MPTVYQPTGCNLKKKTQVWNGTFGFLKLEANPLHYAVLGWNGGRFCSRRRSCKPLRCQKMLGKHISTSLMHSRRYSARFFMTVIPPSLFYGIQASESKHWYSLHPRRLHCIHFHGIHPLEIKIWNSAPSTISTPQSRWLHSICLPRNPCFRIQASSFSRM